MYRLFRLDIHRTETRNAWYLVVEIFWAAVLASAATFNSAFAVRLGATNVDIGLLSSLPALLAVLVSIPAGRFLQRRAREKPWIVSALALYRTGFLMVGLTPWLNRFGVDSGRLVIAILVAASSAAHFFNVGWIPMLAHVVPEENRAAVFAARNIIYNATMSACIFLFGQWLDRVIFPRNYQWMYIAGYAASLLSLYFIIKVQVPGSEKRAPASAARRKSIKARLATVRQMLAEQPGFTRLTLNTLLHGAGTWAATPLYILYFVRELDASEAWIGTQGMIASLGTILGFAIWRWVIARWGEARTLKLNIQLLGLYPILVGVLPGLTPILLAVALNGMIVPGTNLSHFNTLLKVIPSDRREVFTAIYMTAANFGQFLFPLLGVAAAGIFGLAPTLVGCGLLSLAGSASFWIWPVQAPPPAPVQAAEPASVE
jgi:MFS family permease